MFFSKEWIANVARIAEDIKNVDKIYELYGDLEMIKSELERRSSFESAGILSEFNNTKFENIISKYSDKIFNVKFIKEHILKNYDEFDGVALDINIDLNEIYRDVMIELKNLKDKML